MIKKKFGVSGHAYVDRRTFDGIPMRFGKSYEIAPNSSEKFSFSTRFTVTRRYKFQRLVLYRGYSEDVMEAHIRVERPGGGKIKIDSSATQDSRLANVLVLNEGEKKAILIDYNDVNKCLQGGNTVLMNKSGKRVSWRLMTRADKNKYGVGAHDNISKRLAWYTVAPDDTFAPAFSQNKYDALTASGSKSRVCLDFSGERNWYQRVIVGTDQGLVKGAYFTIEKGKLAGKIENNAGITLLKGGITNRTIEVR